MVNKIPDKYKDEIKKAEQDRKSKAKYLRDIIEAGVKLKQYQKGGKK